MYRPKANVPIVIREITANDLVIQEAEELIEEAMTKTILTGWDAEKVYDTEMKSRIETQFSYQYPHATGNIVKQKMSVSELKKRAYEEEEGVEVFREEEVIPLLPKFLQETETLTGASRGTAYHKLLELLDFSKEYDESSLEESIREMKAAGYLDEEMAACIRRSDIMRFLDSPIAKRMHDASVLRKCYSEQPFVLGIDATRVYEEAEKGEQVLVQGIIDVYFEEDKELVVVDYKTDRVSVAKELTDRYRAQLEYYAEALERLTGKRVKEKKIYSFALHREIEV